MILHKFNASPFVHATIKHSLARCQPKDGIVLTEEAVYAVQDETLCNELSSLDAQVYVLQSDLIARGLEQQCHPFESIDYNGLVDLSLAFDKVISW